MLKTTLLHPEILNALAGAGHGAQVLIADGNYPASTGGNPRAVFASPSKCLVPAVQYNRHAHRKSNSS